MWRFQTQVSPRWDRIYDSIKGKAFLTILGDGFAQKDTKLNDAEL